MAQYEKISDTKVRIIPDESQYPVVSLDEVEKELEQAEQNVKDLAYELEDAQNLVIQREELLASFKNKRDEILAKRDAIRDLGVKTRAELQVAELQVELTTEAIAE
jgi:predicted  nucleic acid-binding Zn-ribbon protein